MLLYKENGNWELKLEDNRVEQYFSAPYVNNSLLNLCFNPIWLKWKLENKEVEDSEKRHFRIGSAVDCLLTDPEKWEKEFYIFTESRPSGLMGKFIDALPIHWELMSEDEKKEAYIEAYKKSGYKKKQEAVVKAFLEHPPYVAYFRARQLALHKRILSLDEMEEVENCVNAIKAVPHIKEWFYPLNGDTQNRRVYHQVDFYFEFENVKCKALLDGVIIDHNKKIIQLFDLKTTGKSTYEFEIPYWQYGYYRQFAFYFIGANIVFKEMIEDGYTINSDVAKPFTAIVTPKKDDGYPALIYDISQNSINLGIKGGDAYISGSVKKIRGIEELINNYKWHMLSNNFDAPKWVYDSNFRIKIEPQISFNSLMILGTD